MATWGEFAAARPDMAEVLLKLLDWIPITYLATVRRDGAPRVHPVCPVIADGRMFVAVPAYSPKRHDLRRDGRYAMHALPGQRDDEFYVTGRALLIEDEATRRLVVEAAKHAIHSDDWIFEFDVEHVMTAYWENRGQPDTHAVRQLWHADGYRRRGAPRAP